MWHRSLTSRLPARPPACPPGAAPALPFVQPFYDAMHRALKPGGVVCTQAESQWYHLEIIKSLAAMCRSVFVGGTVQYGFTTIPTYPRYEAAAAARPGPGPQPQRSRGGAGRAGNAGACLA